MVCVAGRRGWIVFDSDLTLITVDKHTDAWLADSLIGGRLTGSDSILIRLDTVEFESDLILITVDTHTDAWVPALRVGFNLILLGLDGLA